MQSYIAAKSGQILDGVSMPQPLEEPRGAGCHTTQAQKTRGTMFTTGQVKHLNDLRPGNIVVESEFMLAVHEVFTQMNRSKHKGLYVRPKVQALFDIEMPEPLSSVKESVSDTQPDATTRDQHQLVEDVERQWERAYAYDRQDTQSSNEPQRDLRLLTSERISAARQDAILSRIDQTIFAYLVFEDIQHINGCCVWSVAHAKFLSKVIDGMYERGS